MAISTQKAKSLCTAAEFALVQASSPTARKKLTEAQLKQKIERTRTLRDKFRDLAKQQRGEARGKRKPTGTRAAKGNERTVEKARLFGETLERFQDGLSEVKAREKRDAAKASKPASKKKSTSKKAAANSTSSMKGAASSASKKTEAKKTAPAQRDAPGGGGSHAGTEPPNRGGMLGTEFGQHIGVRSPGSPLSSVSLAGGSLGPLGVSGWDKQQQSRQERRREASQSSKLGREKNLFSRTSQEKIQGHVGARTRRAQARRDAKS